MTRVDYENAVLGGWIVVPVVVAGWQNRRQDRGHRDGCAEKHAKWERRNEVGGIMADRVLGMLRRTRRTPAKSSPFGP